MRIHARCGLGAGPHPDRPVADGGPEARPRGAAPAAWVGHHSDRGVQYASEEYLTLLRAHHIIPSMSRPANPYDNASCESFIKTLKREEGYVHTYRDLDHLRTNIAAFIEQYNRGRLHSALGYSSPEEFEQAASSATTATGAPCGFSGLERSLDRHHQSGTMLKQQKGV
jgi:hypothetical protein